LFINFIFIISFFSFSSNETSAEDIAEYYKRKYADSER